MSLFNKNKKYFKEITPLNKSFGIFYVINEMSIKYNRILCNGEKLVNKLFDD